MLRAMRTQGSTCRRSHQTPRHSRHSRMPGLRRDLRAHADGCQVLFGCLQTEGIPRSALRMRERCHDAIARAVTVRPRRCPMTAEARLPWMIQPSLGLELQFLKLQQPHHKKNRAAPAAIGTARCNLKDIRMSDIRDCNSTSRSQSQSQSQSQTQKEESKRADAPAANDDWAWKGKVVRLNQADYAAWKKAYSALDLDGELITRDAFLSDQPREVQARWVPIDIAAFQQSKHERKGNGGSLATARQSRPPRGWSGLE